jgi:hypothetical protein
VGRVMAHCAGVKLLAGSTITRHPVLE